MAMVAGAGVAGAFDVDGPAADAGGGLGFRIVRTESWEDVNVVYL